MTNRRVILSAILVLLVVLSIMVFNFARSFILRPASTNATYRLVEVVTGFKNPLYVTSAMDGSGRLFVVEQDGLIRIVRDNQILEAPFLDVKTLVSRDGSE
ncbi:MAG: hypothetical protein K8I30_14335, partial [Anaerolineae bacterium]|nr:hypothetical protein [Anaerolineae bacterium]